MSRENKFFGEYQKGSSDNPQYHKRDFVATTDITDPNLPTEDELIGLIERRRSSSDDVYTKQETDHDEPVGVEDRNDEEYDDDGLSSGNKPPSKEGMKARLRRSGSS